MNRLDSFESSKSGENSANNETNNVKSRNRIMYFLEVNNLTLEDLKVNLKDKIREDSIEDIALCKKCPTFRGAQLISKLLDVPVDVLFPNDLDDVESIIGETKEYLICGYSFEGSFAKIVRASSFEEAKDLAKEAYGDNEYLCVIPVSEIPREIKTKSQF